VNRPATSFASFKAAAGTSSSQGRPAAASSATKSGGKFSFVPVGSAAFRPVSRPAAPPVVTIFGSLPSDGNSNSSGSNGSSSGSSHVPSRTPAAAPLAGAERLTIRERMMMQQQQQKQKSHADAPPRGGSAVVASTDVADAAGAGAASGTFMVLEI
jgi:hypothetical protein